jgi:hypothetical protein
MQQQKFNPTLFPHTITIVQLLLGVKKRESFQTEISNFMKNSEKLCSTVSELLKTAAYLSRYLQERWHM